MQRASAVRLRKRFKTDPEGKSRTSYEDGKSSAPYPILLAKGWPHEGMTTRKGGRGTPALREKSRSPIEDSSLRLLSAQAGSPRRAARPTAEKSPTREYGVWATRPAEEGKKTPPFAARRMGHPATRFFATPVFPGDYAFPGGGGTPISKPRNSNGLRTSPPSGEIESSTHLPARSAVPIRSKDADESGVSSRLPPPSTAWCRGRRTKQEKHMSQIPGQPDLSVKRARRM